ncbi:MAG: helix-turn-helix domain-containing protein [Alphaproteobacteria bacterium]|nr:helix-turn-helix domain-containing protein [Alphaproteobacteria bacterium]
MRLQTLCGVLGTLWRDFLEVKMMTQDNKEASVLNSAQQTEEETVGALLRRTRLAKNQDLRDIASYLCIRYQFLEALEEGRYKELPGEAYANGFIRSYAAYLGLNPADIISRYKQEFFSQSKRENGIYTMSSEDAENIVPAPKVLIASIVLLLIAFGLWQASSENKKASLPVETDQVDSITIVDQSYPLPLEETAKPTEEDVQPAAVPPVLPVKPEYHEEKEDPAVLPAAVEPAAAEYKARPEAKPQEPRVYGQKNYNPRLVLVATEETWIEITRGETVLFSRLLNTGDQYWVSSNKPEELFLKTGNAGGLEIYCDGSLTQSLGPRGALRSNIPLIPDDFAAKIIEDIE